MGVMKCYRNGCDKIMCDYYNDEFGYLCWECKEELEIFCKINGVSRQSIKMFMSSEKHGIDYNDVTIDDIFRMSD
jgi:hypothetical protein